MFCPKQSQLECSPVYWWQKQHMLAVKPKPCFRVHDFVPSLFILLDIDSRSKEKLVWLLLTKMSILFVSWRLWPGQYKATEMLRNVLRLYHIWDPHWFVSMITYILSNYKQSLKTININHIFFFSKNPILKPFINFSSNFTQVRGMLEISTQYY